MLIMSQGENLAMGTPSEIRALARSKENPEPTIEDAFIALAQGSIAPSCGQNLMENGGGGK
jgi:ABC-2 type transport system ATP-binding protein